MKKLALSLALLAAAAASPMLASADAAKSVAVKTADLNLSSEAGVQVLYHRLQAASRSVCKDLAGPSARTRVAHERCLSTALDGAVLAAKNDALTSLHVATTGEAASVVASK